MSHRFRKKHTDVVAWCFSGHNQHEVLRFVYPLMSREALHGARVMQLPIVIQTPRGEETVSPGDWVVHDVKGDFHVVNPEIFEATYEVVPE